MTAYFAVDPMGEGTVDALLSAWSALRRSHPSVRCYALVDAAFDEKGFATALEDFRGGAASVYAGTDLAELQEVSPWLLELNVSSDQSLADDVTRVARLRGSRPMCTFLASHWSLRELCRHLRSCVYALVGDLRLILRFADTRILEAVIRLLPPEQVDILFPGQIHVWLPCRRDGQVAVRPLTPSTADPEPAGPLHLDDTQYAALIEAGDADLIIHNIASDAPECFGEAQPSEVHAFIAGQLKRATSHGLHSPADLLAYCLTALATDECFDDQPDIAFAIAQAAQQPGRLTEMFHALPEAAWLQARSAAKART